MAVLLLGACTGLDAPDERSPTSSTESSRPKSTTSTAVTADQSRTLVDLLDGSELTVEASHQLELIGYFFTIAVPGIGSSNVDLVPRVDPVDASAVDQAAVLESDLGNGVRIWRADRAGQPIFMTVDLGGWVASLHVGNDEPPNTELLLSIADDLRGEARERGVVLPGDGVDVFTTYLRQPSSENSLALGIGQCHRELVPASEVVEHVLRGEVVRGPGYASWCDPGNDLEVSVHGDDDFVDSIVDDLRLARRGPFASELGHWSRAAVGESEVGRPGDQIVSGIAVGPSGFVAVGEDERSASNEDNEAAVWTSSTGEQWKRVGSDAGLVDSAMTDVVWFADEQLFVAVGRHVSRGAVWVSPDGEAWERVALLEFAGPGGGIEVDAISVIDGGLLAVGKEWLSEGASIAAVWFSTDARRWERTGDLSQLGDEDAMVDIIQHADTVFAVGYVDHSKPTMWVSTDLTEWQVVSLESQISAGVTLHAIATDQTTLVVSGAIDAEEVDARVWASTDGQTWRGHQQDSLTVGIPTLEDVTHTPHGWLAVGRDGTTYRPKIGAAVWLSQEGEMWHRYPVDAAAFSPDPAALAMTSITFGDGVGVAGGVTGENCVDRFAQCDLDAAFWVWDP